MAKQVVKLGLEFDTKSAIQSYRDLVSELSKGGADPKAIKQFTSAIEKAETELAQLAAEGSTGFTDSKGIEQYQKKVLKTVTSMQQLALRMQEFSKSGDNFPTSEVKKLEAEIEKLKKKITDAQKAAKDGLVKSLTTNGGFSKKEAEAIAETVKTEEQLIARLEEEKKLRDEIRKSAQPAAEKATNAIKDKAIARDTSGSQVVMDAVGMNGKKGVKAIREAVAASLQEGIREGWSAEDVKKNALEAMKNAGISEKLAQEFEAGFNLKTIETELKRVQDEINKNSAVKKYNEANKSYNQVASGSTENYSQFIAKSKEAEKAQQDLATAENQVNQAAINSANAQKKSADTAGQQATMAEQAANKFMQMSNAQKDSVKSTEALEGGFNRLADRLKYMFGFTAMFNRLRQIIRSTFNDIQALDKAYASIAYVTNETVADLWSTYGKYAGMAEKLGQSTADVIKASAIYRQQGLDTAEALELTTDTMKLATIAGNDYSTATQEMTAALRGFKMEMDEGGHVSDVYSELAAHAAASVDDIAQAMSRTASIANSAGMSFENTSAFLTQMIETTQESAENIGTSMKTIIARFTELKENVAGTADSEFDDLSFNKVDEALKSVGVSLKDTTGQFRNLDEVFLELSEKWGTLDRNTQRYIATVAAGSRQQSRFIALMDNYDRTIELINTAADSEGKADEQFAKAADTIEFKLNSIKTKWEEFKLSIMNSDFVKGLLDKVDGLMDRLKNVKMPQVAIFSTFAVLAAKKFVLSFINTIKQTSTNFQKIGQIIGEKINNKLNKYNKKITLQAEIEILEAKKQDLINKYSSIENELPPISVDFDPSNIDQIDDKIKEYDTLLNNIGTDTDALKQVEKIFNNQEMSVEEASEALRKYIELLKLSGKININAADLGEKQLQLAKNNALGQALTQTIRSATMAISGFASGAMSAKDAIKTFAYSSITSIGNLALSMVTATIATKGLKDAMIALQTTALPLLAIMVAIAAAAGIAYGIAQLKERNKQLKTEYQLQEKINKIKKLQQNVSSAKSDVDNAKQELKTTEEKIDRFKELQEMQYRTAEEQEEYNNLVEEIRSEFPSIVEYYNSITGQLTIQEEKTQKMLDMQKELVVEQQKSYAMVQNTLYDTEISKANLEAQQKLEKYQGLSDINNLKQDKYSPFERGVAGASVESKRSTFSQGIDNAKKANLDSQSAIEYNLERYGIDKNTFLKQAGYGENLTTEQWDELAEKLTNESNSIYDMINDAVENSKKAIDDERKATIQYYKDMKAASIKQTLLTEYEGLGEASAQMISDSIADKEYDFLKGTETGTYIDSMKEKSNITAFDDTKDAAATAAGVVAAPIGLFGAVSSIVTGVKAIVAGFENNLDEWDDLKGEQREIWAKIAEREGADNAEDWYNDIRKDPEKYKEYIDDYESMAAADAGIKAAESFAKALEDNPELANSFEEYGQKLSEGAFTQNGATNQANALIERIKQSDLDDTTKENMINSVTTAKQNYNESLQNNMNSVAGLSDDKKWKNYVNNLTGKELEDLKVAMDKIVEASSEEAGKEYLKSLSGVIEEEGPDVAASLAKAIDFTEANVYNWDNFKQNAIQTITEVTGKQGEEAENLFNEMAKAAEKNGIYNKIFSGGDANEIETELQAREDALYKHKEIIDKISATNKPLELSSQDLKKLQKAVSDLNAAGIDLDLSEYLDGNKLKTEEFNNALKESIFLFGDFEAAFANAENDEVKNRLKSILGLVTGFKQGVEQDFSGLDKFNRKINDIGVNVDNVNSIMSQFLSDSYVNAESLKSLAETLGNDELVSKFVDDQLRLNTAALKEWIDTEIKRVEVEILAGNATKYQLLQLEALKRSLENSEKEWDEQAQSIQDNYNQALEDLSKAQEDVIEKQKSLNDAIKEYNDLLGGSENRKSTLDLLYNYEESLKALADEESRLKDAFTDSSSYDDAAKNFKKLLDTTKKELLQWEAENQVRNTELGNMRNYLLNGVETIEDEYNGETISINLGDYVRIDENGIAAVAQDLLNAASIPDLWKNKIEEMASTYNKTLEEIRKTTDQISKKEKEMIKMHQDAVKGWADFETSIADELKKRYQEQIDALKNKYDSMKEADDDYIDALSEAIEKQRKLREKEFKYSDLAKKEKKLSLMNRDTSGANQIERLKLEQEIEKDRETLLDESINEVIDNMKLLYESQDELRQSEIELKEALLDDALYWNTTAENVASSFQSVDDYLNMITTDNKEFADMNAAQQQAFIIEQTEKFNQASQNAAVIAFNSIESIEERLQLSSEEVNTTVETTTNAFVGEMARMAAETRIEMNDTMDSAIQKIVSAQEALNEANQKLAEAATKVNEIASTINGMSYNGGGETVINHGDASIPGDVAYEIEHGGDSGVDYSDTFDFYLKAMGLDQQAVLTEYLEAKTAINSLGRNYVELFPEKKLTQSIDDWIKQTILDSGVDLGDLKLVRDKSTHKLFLYKNGAALQSDASSNHNLTAYKSGGLVNYTGPAWVDGTPDRPESFLSAEDTERIGNAAKLLADIPALNPSSNISNTNTSFGDTNIEINLNIDHISSDVDVESMLNRVKEEIVEIARPTGTNVILQQRI